MISEICKVLLQGSLDDGVDLGIVLPIQKKKAARSQGKFLQCVDRRLENRMKRKQRPAHRPQARTVRSSAAARRPGPRRGRARAGRVHGRGRRLPRAPRGRSAPPLRRLGSQGRRMAAASRGAPRPRALPGRAWPPRRGAAALVEDGGQPVPGRSRSRLGKSGDWTLSARRRCSQLVRDTAHRVYIVRSLLP